MSSELSAPPPRDLPLGRLAARAQHLRAEIARQPVGRFADRKRLVAAVAIVVALAAALLATPAFGLRDRIVNLFAVEQPERQRPPELIQRYFRNMYDARPDESTGVVASKARVAIRLAIPGYGHKTLWVAPTRAGGYCSNVGCNRTRSTPFEVQMQIAGPTSVNSSPMAGSRDQHVFLLGDTSLQKARGITIRFEDGGFERTPLVWVSKPIDAGFFLYLLPKSHWKPGERPIAIEVDDAKGRTLARDYRIAGYFIESQLAGLAPPPKELNRLWLLLPFAVALLTAATLVDWRRRRC
ncbi:MAG: hypothetical protein ACJ75Q_04560 [Gaiellaceae bacterium]